ncbi:MAG TPA: carboxypeptidase regulatory-like domain-containing protein [Pyrinomonadaceae bacterium]|jgi:hypothetical protein
MPGSISGQVTANGVGQSGVTVRATPGSINATTNSQGNYMITNLNAGNYSVFVVPGAGTYTPAQQPVTLTQNQNKTGVNFAKQSSR